MSRRPVFWSGSPMVVREGEQLNTSGEERRVTFDAERGVPTEGFE